MLGAMAKKEGLTFVETLTGFKWMANEAYDLESLTGKDIFRSSLCICIEEALIGNFSALNVAKIAWQKCNLTTNFLLKGSSSFITQNYSV
jgi:phosphomannomutase